jgi:hypothetical protein
MAIRGFNVTGQSFQRVRASQRSVSDGEDFTAIIMAARGAQVVRALQLTAIAAFLKRFGRQRIVAAAHPALRRGGFAFWNSHYRTCLTYRLVIRKARPIAANPRVGNADGRAL